MTIMSKFQRNAVLVGCIDSYCLVCEAHLKNDDDALAHIVNTAHTNNLKSTQYSEKYREDCIWKVNSGYFCQFCNLLMSTPTRVGLHIMETKHQENKTGNQLQHVGNTIIAFEDICINDKAWNGFIDDTCVLCGTEFTNEDLHHSEPQHLINLVQSKPEFGADKNIYRKIDQDSFQCLTCNIVLPTMSKVSHFGSSDHKNQYEKCRVACGGTQNTSDFEKQNEEINVEPQNSKENTQPEKPNEGSTSKQTPTNNANKPTEDPTCQILEAKDYIIVERNQTAWCILCDWTFVNEVKHMHVHSKHHQTLLKLHLNNADKKEFEDKFFADAVDFQRVANSQPHDKSKILDAMARFNKNEIDIDFNREIVICKRCSKNINFDYDSIEKHVEEHKKNEQVFLSLPSTSTANTNKPQVTETPEPQSFEERPPVPRRPNDPAISDDHTSSFMRQNHIIFRGHKSFCKLCKIEMPRSMGQIIDHASTSTHQAKILNEEVQIDILAFNKRPMGEFIRSLSIVSDMFIKEFIINEEFCISMLSFLCISKVNSKLTCELCQQTMTMEEVDTHKNLYSHITGMQETRVIAAMENEFIREVRQNVFHCGFCNLVKHTWENMEAHLNTAEHEESRNSAYWRLGNHISAVRLSRQDSLEMALIMRMYFNGMSFPF